MTYAILSAWQIPISHGVCEWQLQSKGLIKGGGGGGGGGIYIYARTKWPTICRRNPQKHFSDKIFYFNSNFLQKYPKTFSWTQSQHWFGEWNMSFTWSSKNMVSIIEYNYSKHIFFTINTYCVHFAYTIWRQISGSTLAQVMACCLTATIHYPNQCWFAISKVHWH